MARAGPGGRVALRLVAIAVGLSGLACLAFPVLSLVRDSGLIDDTRASFGAGTAKGVPVVSQVGCFDRVYGASSTASRSVRSRSSVCTFYIAPAEEPAVAKPQRPAIDKAAAPPNYEGLSYEEAMAQYRAETKRVMDANKAEMERYDRESAQRLDGIGDERLPAYLERELPFHPGDRLPTLRRLSGEGEPLRFGIVWDRGALAWQWLSWAFFSILFLAFGAACLYAMRVVWLRTRRLTSPAA